MSAPDTDAVRVRLEEVLRECVAAGLPQAVILKALRDARASFGPPGFMERSERNAEIVRRFEAGEAMADIARSCGVTRERARQIVHRAGVPSAWDRARDRHRAIANAIGDGLTAKEIAEKFGVREWTVYWIAKRFNVPIRRRMKDEPLLTQLAERVRAGESYWSASGHDRSVQVRLRRYCIKNGIRSQARTRWNNSEVPASQSAAGIARHVQQSHQEPRSEP